MGMTQFKVTFPESQSIIKRNPSQKDHQSLSSQHYSHHLLARMSIFLLNERITSWKSSLNKKEHMVKIHHRNRTYSSSNHPKNTTIKCKKNERQQISRTSCLTRNPKSLMWIWSKRLLKILNREHSKEWEKGPAINKASIAKAHLKICMWMGFCKSLFAMMLGRRKSGENRIWGKNNGNWVAKKGPKTGLSSLKSSNN